MQLWIGTANELYYVIWRPPGMDGCSVIRRKETLLPKHIDLIVVEGCSYAIEKLLSLRIIGHNVREDQKYNKINIYWLTYAWDKLK